MVSRFVKRETINEFLLRTTNVVWDHIFEKHFSNSRTIMVKLHYHFKVPARRLNINKRHLALTANEAVRTRQLFKIAIELSNAAKKEI